MNRRNFLGATAAGAALSVFDWLRYFDRNGVPGTAKQLGIAEAAAQATGTPRFLIYWFLEGGWDGYSMFNPVATPNDAANGSSLPLSQQTYRPVGVALDGNRMYPVQQQGAIRYGHLAAEGVSLFPQMSILSSHLGSGFHSGSRFNYHYGETRVDMSAQRAPDERTVMQAFCEAYGASYLLPHVSFHKWLSDGELSPASYPDGAGYFERLGPNYAHTIYGGTPTTMRARLAQIAKSQGTGRNAVIHNFVDNLHTNFLKDKNSQSVKAFAAAVQAHKTLVSSGKVLDASKLFTDPSVKEEFNVKPGDESTSATSVDDNPARSKGSPKANVQALMASELIINGLTTGVWIESRDVRSYDAHNSRQSVLRDRGQVNQIDQVNADLWAPLNAFISRLKGTQHAGSGKSLWDLTTVVIASEMGRSMGANGNSSDDDVCQHWNVSSAAFLGAGVKEGGTQFGRVGTVTRSQIPIMPDGSLDPSFDPTTGQLKPGMRQSANSFVTDHGHVYATALELAGIPKSMQTGKNQRPALSFVQK